VSNSAFTKAISNEKCESDMGYIIFTRDDLSCRTQEAVSFADRDAFTFIDYTIVVDQNDSGNIGILAALEKRKTTLSITNMSSYTLSAVSFAETAFNDMNSGASDTHGIVKVEGFIYFLTRVANMNIGFMVSEIAAFTVDTGNDFTITDETVVTETAADRTGPLQELLAAIIAEIPPPSGINVNALSTASIQLGWPAVPGVASYNIYRSDSSAGDYKCIAAPLGTTTSYIDNGLTASTTYWYKITSLKNSYEGEPSDAVCQTTFLSTPVGVDLSAGNEKLTARWEAVNRASSYNLYYGTGAIPPETPAKTNVTATTSIISGLSNETSYYVWVQAVNTDGVSALSEKATGTPANTYTVNTAAAFNHAISNINGDTGDGAYTINVIGNFATSGVTFTANGNKTITIKGDSENRSISNGGTTVLFTITRGITLELDNNITLDGNNKMAGLVSIATGGTLEMKTGSTITRAHWHAVLITGGMLTMTGGTISGNSTPYSYGVGTSYEAVFGSVPESSAYGGAVFIDSGTFTMSGGAISGNYANYYYTSEDYSYSYGGGVYINSGTFTMNGGTISGNSTDGSAVYSYGGGVYVNNGTFTMSGGTISENAVPSYSFDYSRGGGVYIKSGIFTMSGGTISGNSASGYLSLFGYGGGVYIYNGSFSKTGGIIDNTNTARYGRVAYVYSGSKKRNSTAGTGVNLNSATQTNWE
jgi:fibronectin type 3 domain-containing protein